MNYLTIDKVPNSTAVAHYAEDFAKYTQVVLKNAPHKNPNRGVYAYTIPLFGIVLSCKFGPRSGGLYLTSKLAGTKYYGDVRHTVYHGPDWNYDTLPRHARNLLRRTLALRRDRLLAAPLLDSLIPALKKLASADKRMFLDFLEDAYSIGYDPGTQIIDHTLYLLYPQQLERLYIAASKYIKAL